MIPYFQVPRNRYWGLHPPPKPVEDVVADGLLAIQRAIFLRKAGVETLIDDDFLLSTYWVCFVASFGFGTL